MSDDLRHNMNLVIPGLNFWGDQNDAAKSVVDKTKWVMETAINRIEKLEEENGVLFVANVRLNSRADLDSDQYVDRTKKLEAALREMLIKCTWENTGRWCGSIDCHCRIARKALEGKDDVD